MWILNDPFFPLFSSLAPIMSILEGILDLAQYPITEPGSAEYREMVAEVRERYYRDGKFWNMRHPIEGST